MKIFNCHVYILNILLYIKVLLCNNSRITELYCLKYRLLQIIKCHLELRWTILMIFHDVEVCFMVLGTKAFDRYVHIHYLPAITRGTSKAVRFNCDITFTNGAHSKSSRAILNHRNNTVSWFMNTIQDKLIIIISRNCCNISKYISMYWYLVYRSSISIS